MNIKDDLRNLVQEQLVSVASPFLLNRALLAIEESHDDKKSLLAAVEKVSRIITLFIDTNLSKKVFIDLRRIIDTSG
jgi:hypothetical protein